MSARCPDCGAELGSRGSPAGPCPTCSLELGNAPTAALPADAGRTITEGGAGDSVPANVPDRIGSYRIVGLLGEGGMGVVYEAEQQSPRRTVALKVVRGGQFVDEDRVRMFQREADALARLKHPNIGAIHESGRTEDGQHFFAMELVRGDTLLDYLGKRSHTLGPEALDLRLRLFTKICDAVHYAHQRGVIHRDLKPDNIIVTENAVSDSAASSSSGVRAPEIKILDFGLARITEGDVAAATMATDVGVIKGTLPYMSPEQARGNPEEIELRSDVYALGVILYEMLTGSRPYDVSRKSLVEAVRVICEEPPRSIRSSWKGARKLDPDIETIVGKALDKDAERRYGSAAALSEDVARYLASQPILARPPSAMYQLRKFARRNRALVGGVAATFVVLVVGVVVSTTFAFREASQRRAVERAQAGLEQMVEFQARTLSEVDPELLGRRLVEDQQEQVAGAARSAGASEAEVEAALASLTEATRGANPTNTALRMLDEGILRAAGARIEQELSGQPLVAARLLLTIGEAYAELDLAEQAELHTRRAAEIRGEELGGDHSDTLSAQAALAWILRLDESRVDEAEQLLRRVLAQQRERPGADHADTLRSMRHLAEFRRVAGRLDEAETLLSEALETARRSLGPDHPERLDLLRDRGNLHSVRGDHAEAERLLLEALQGARRIFGPAHPQTVEHVAALGFAYFRTGEYDKAAPLLVNGYETASRVLGDAHRTTQWMAGLLAATYNQQGRTNEAQALWEKLKQSEGQGRDMFR